MASQVVTAEKRFRVSLLLDAYGDLLTGKQRTFLRHYFEEDLSFGEIAREYGVSRQAIFDSVKHGEEALEHFEKVLGLVGGGWSAWMGGAASPQHLVERLQAICEQMTCDDVSEGERLGQASQSLREIIRDLSSTPSPEADAGPDEYGETPKEDPDPSTGAEKSFIPISATSSE